MLVSHGSAMKPPLFPPTTPGATANHFNTLTECCLFFNGNMIHTLHKLCWNTSNHQQQDLHRGGPQKKIPHREKRNSKNGSTTLKTIKTRTHRGIVVAWADAGTWGSSPWRSFAKRTKKWFAQLYLGALLFFILGFRYKVHCKRQIAHAILFLCAWKWAGKDRCILDLEMFLWMCGVRSRERWSDSRLSLQKEQKCEWNMYFFGDFHELTGQKWCRNYWFTRV